jgi:hypothetical protein
MGRSHTMVLPNQKGFNGKCLPKDLSAIVEAATKTVSTRSYCAPSGISTRSGWAMTDLVIEILESLLKLVSDPKTQGYLRMAIRRQEMVAKGGKR